MFIKKGQNVTVIIPKNYLPSEKYAAEELCKYLGLMLGVKSAILTDEADGKGIFVGNTRSTQKSGILPCDLTCDGVVIAEKEGNLYLCGQGTRGTLYSVYEFLEKQGVRFLTPDCEYVPKMDGIQIESDYFYKYQPVIQMRDVMWCNCFDVAFTAKQKVNRGHYRKFTDQIGGGKTYAGWFGHTLGEDAETGYDAPEPCLSDERIYQTVKKNQLKKLEANPKADYISVSQNDDYRFCTCEECRKKDEYDESNMGSMLQFVNRIADDLKTDYPDLLVHTFAYQYTRKPPKHTLPRDNVMIQLCSIECCFRHPLRSCKTPAPAPWATCVSEDFAEDLARWGKIAKNLHVWDYTTNFHHYFAPFPNLQVLRENVRFFADNNVTGILEQGNINSKVNGEFGDLKGYLLAKLLWNSFIGEEEYQQLIDEFLRLYYGAGWQFIRQYIDGLHEVTAKRHIGIYYHPLKILPKEEGVPFMKKAAALFDKAYAATEDGKQKHRILLAKVQVEYYLLIAEYEERFANGSEESRKAYVEDNKKFHAFIVQNGIYMNPDKTIVEQVDYEQSPDMWHKLG